MFTFLSSILQELMHGHICSYASETLEKRAKALLELVSPDQSTSTMKVNFIVVTILLSLSL